MRLMAVLFLNVWELVQGRDTPKSWGEIWLARYNGIIFVTHAVNRRPQSCCLRYVADHMSSVVGSSSNENERYVVALTVCESSYDRGGEGGYLIAREKRPISVSDGCHTRDALVFGKQRCLAA